MLNALAGGDALEILVTMKDLSQAGFKNLQGNLAKTEAMSGTAGTKVGGMGSSLGALGVPLSLAAAGLGAVATEGLMAAQAYQEHEVAVGRLTASLNANVPAWQASSEEIKKAIEASTKLGFTDTETTNAMAGLVAATHDVGQATHVLAVAQDLARFKDISLQDASLALTSIEAGRARGLAQLGINVKDYSTTEERLAAVEKVASGQAQTYANSGLGKLAVASAEAEAAQEKLGKEVLWVEAVVIPAAADAFGRFADQVDFVSTAYDRNASAAEKQSTANQYLRDSWAMLIPGVKTAIADSEAATAAQFKAALAADTHSEALNSLAGHIGELGPAETTAVAPGSAMQDVLSKIAKAAGDASSAIPGLASAIDDQLFGKAINAGHIQELKDSNKELEKQRDHVKKNSPLYVELTGKIAANNKALFDLGLAEAETKGPDYVLSFLKNFIKKNGDATGAVQALIDKERTLRDLLIKIGPISGGIRFTGVGGSIDVAHAASGGYFPAIPGGRLVNLAEGGEGEYVIPESKIGSVAAGGGTIVHTHIYLDGRQIAEVVDQHRYRSDALAPTSTRGY
jgi:hypothetical protein